MTVEYLANIVLSLQQRIDELGFKIESLESQVNANRVANEFTISNIFPNQIQPKIDVIGKEYIN